MIKKSNIEKLFERAQLEFACGDSSDTNSVLGSDRPLVLYGIGGLGTKVAKGLYDQGLCFQLVDDTPEKIGRVLFDQEIVSLNQCVSDLDLVVVVTIFLPMVSFSDIAENIRLSLPNAEVVSFVKIFNLYPKIFLPWMLFESPKDTLSDERRYLQLAASLNDEESLTCLYDYLELKLYGDSSLLSSCVGKSDIPFALKTGSILVDCGAYDGDTIESYLERYDSEFSRVYAFEPDPRNSEFLARNVSRLGYAEKVVIFSKAVGKKYESVLFSSTGDMGAQISAEGDVEVDVVPLDEVLPMGKPMYIKLDVEGNEREALSGAKNILSEGLADIAISVYHKPKDLIDLFEYMLSMNYDCFYLRPHGYSGADILLYARKTLA
ncbi:FkbM family methyltransferase [Oceanicoccus sp. KOV_DT_Chl]|uniref:FkbM family methyltransferase n=1 Tax=Oceanicoccus sp. KOV_DT_Chl TaxID=1904639 RepID=UPI000C7C2C91|nr:FkbM family methyltransferase [Oceanicoccus sp. KOV_DT_Chl]